MNISLKKEELDYLKEVIGDHMVRIADNENGNHEDLIKTNKNYQRLDNLDRKLTKSLNKTGKWYKWQLKDDSKPVTRENIMEEWL